MTQHTPRLRLSAVAGLVALIGLSLVWAYLWGPLHPTYERICELYPVLRSVGPVPLIVLVTTGLASATIGVGSLLTGTIRSVRLANRIRAREVEAPLLLQEATSGLGIRDGVVCIESPYPLAFCFGLFRPMVCVSRPMLTHLEPEEFRAVLVHEREHLRARDPLRLMCMRALARALFMIPAADEMYRRYVLRRELKADESCIVVCQREPLISALLKLITAHPVATDVVAGFNLLEERIEHIVHPATTSATTIPWSKASGQVIVLAGLAMAAVGILAGSMQSAVVGCLL